MPGRTWADGGPRCHSRLAGVHALLPSDSSAEERTHPAHCIHRSTLSSRLIQKNLLNCMDAIECRAIRVTLSISIFFPTPKNVQFDTNK